MAKTALVVDDVPYARQIIKDILTSAKYIVIGEASNGDEAVRMYGELKPDFVTMDVVMPEKGGIEATRNIMDNNKEARIIIVSAMAHEHLLMDAISAGARDYILKPFSKEDLLKAVVKALQKDETNAKKGASAKA
ncbi:MAG: response regulator [Bacteriovoracia bacterium]